MTCSICGSEAHFRAECPRNQGQCSAPCVVHFSSTVSVGQLAVCGHRCGTPRWRAPGCVAMVPSTCVLSHDAADGSDRPSGHVRADPGSSVATSNPLGPSPGQPGVEAFGTIHGLGRLPPMKQMPCATQWQAPAGEEWVDRLRQALHTPDILSPQPIAELRHPPLWHRPYDVNYGLSYFQLIHEVRIRRLAHSASRDTTRVQPDAVERIRWQATGHALRSTLSRGPREDRRFDCKYGRDAVAGS